MVRIEIILVLHEQITLFEKFRSGIISRIDILFDGFLNTSEILIKKIQILDKIGSLLLNN